MECLRMDKKQGRDRKLPIPTITGTQKKLALNLRERYLLGRGNLMNEKYRGAKIRYDVYELTETGQYDATFYVSRFIEGTDTTLQFHIAKPQRTREEAERNAIHDAHRVIDRALAGLVSLVQ